MLKAAPLALPLLVACGGERASEENRAQTTANVSAPLAPPALDDTGGLSGGDTPVPEGAAGAGGAREAANRLETYYALIGAGDYEAAWALRWHGEGDDSASRAAFIASFERYAEYRAQVGTPSPIAGAAGSLYVDVPVQIYGRMQDGQPFATVGVVTMRRINDIPGSTSGQRRWRVYSRD